MKTQNWSTVCSYVLVALLRKRLDLEHLSLYTILQFVSVTASEQVPILQALSHDGYTIANSDNRNQLQLFNL